MAGYRGAFAAGDAAVLGELLAVRRHLGFIVPAPVQAAMLAALSEDSHVDRQRAVYADRRSKLRAALESAGFTIDHSQASLYLWATETSPVATPSTGWPSAASCSAGDFYGPAGERHVRVAFTATDERVAAAVARLTSD